ncbi:MAG: L-glutamine---4-(methylsulfanyl)-2-oxobutanoate aminotransferase [Chloroflexota bacterium]|nr:L-glutamine---4-(methylsulfanyl)-2-oxobutanoate aminotransferase [Chloroflexota bacterium]
MPASSSATGPSASRATLSDRAHATAPALDFGAMRPSRISAKAERFTESVIREMNRLAVAHGAIGLAQGFPDFACPPELKRAVADAVDADINQYAITWGSKPLRDAIAETTPRHFPGWGAIDPETQITVTCGATEAMMAAMLGLLDPGDEVIVFEPYYENYGPDAILSGATPRYVTLHEPDWSIDPDELRRAFNAKTRGIVVNSPHNPTGKVYTRDELELIAALCREFDVIAFTDDIYEHLVFEGEHIPLATLPGMAERTVSIHSMSKTYSVTGWRIGWAIAPADLSIGIRRVHDFLTVGAAAPLQAAAVTALAFPPEYYASLLAGYRERRDILVPALEAAGFRVHRPAGAYYVMTDIRDLTDEDDVAFAHRLIRDPGVAAVPGSSFFSRPELGRTKLRFAFPKRRETLVAAAERLASLRTASPR